jgi:hypothetical protein
MKTETERSQNLSKVSNKNLLILIPHFSTRIKHQRSQPTSISFVILFIFFNQIIYGRPEAIPLSAPLVISTCCSSSTSYS